MKRIVFFILFFSLKIVSQEPVVYWGGKIGGISYDSSQAANIDPTGNLYLTGGFGYIADFDLGTGTYNMLCNGQSAGYLAKYNSNGMLQWGKEYTGNYFTFGFGVDFDGVGNIYAMGTFNDSVDFDPGPSVFTMTAPTSPYVTSDIYLTKLDSNGNFVFAKQITGQGVKDPTAFTVDAAGNMYVTGYFNNVTQFSGTVSLTPSNGVTNNTIYDIFVAKYSNMGSLLWVKQFGYGSISQRTEEMVLDANGNLYLCGQFHTTTDFDPSPTGVYTMAPSFVNNVDMFVMKLDNNGNFVWAKNMGGTPTSSNTAKAMQLDVSGNLYLTGSFYLTVDFDPGNGIHSLTTPSNTGFNGFVLKLDPNGSFIWVKHLIGNAVGNALVVDFNGKVTVTGQFNNTCNFSGFGTAIRTTAGQGDAFLAGFGSDGTFEWVKCFGGTQDDRGVDLKRDALGNYFLFGDFSGTASLNNSIGSLSLSSNGSQDVFIIKLGSALDNDSFAYDAVSIFPNPVQNELQLHYTTDYDDAKIEIYAVDGRLIKASAIKQVMDVADLATGAYILKISNTNGKSFQKKFLKK